MPAIVILGGGVMGASVAYHLAARGAREILLIDRADGPGGGSTSRATGGFRAQYATAINVRLSLLSRQKLLRFREEIGGECGYEPVGYLWLASNAREMGILAEARAVQHAAGLHEAVEVSVEDIARINPAVVLEHSREPFLIPEADFEVAGFVPNVVFPTGAVQDGALLLVYYGAADSCTAVAEFSTLELLDSLGSSP